ncbi:MAG: 50S ribosomal protein L1 [Flavobacteriales bacterium]|nr:50S ribosomal protein L1 [Flavobacteriales bacterium]
MARLTKKKKEAQGKYDAEKQYSLLEAAGIVKDITNTNFDSSIEISVRLNVNPTKANEMVRGNVALPHGLGKEVTVLVLCTPDKEEEAKAAGADFVGLDDYIEKIRGGWTDIDSIITMPSIMGKIGALGKVLGPRGLMPNPKTGTVTMEVGKAVTAIKAGKIDFKVDKTGIIHSAVGKASFDKEKISENANELIQTIIKLKPASTKGIYIKSLSMCSTMSTSVSVDTKTL